MDSTNQKRLMPKYNMAALLNALFLVFNISFLPKYYDYIVEWDIM